MGRSACRPLAGSSGLSAQRNCGPSRTQLMLSGRPLTTLVLLGLMATGTMRPAGDAWARNQFARDVVELAIAGSQGARPDVWLPEFARRAGCATGNPDCRRLLAAAAMATGRTIELQRYPLADADSTYHFMAAEALLKAGDHDSAVQHLGAIPGAADLLYTGEGVDIDEGDVTFNDGVFASTAEIVPARSPLRQLAASLLEPQLRNAIDNHEESRMLHPAHGWAYRRLQQLLRVKNDPGRIIALAEQWIALRPSDRFGYVHLSSAFLATRQVEKAIETIDRALANVPLDQDLAYLKGQALYELGRYAEAETVLLTAIDLEPENGSAHLFLARLHRAQHNTEEARRYYLAAIHLSRNRPSVVREYEGWLTSNTR
jgi:hypothetical protein